MPIVAAKDGQTNKITPKVAPSKEVDNYAGEMANKMVEHLGCRRIIMSSDSEPAILASQACVRRFSDVEIVSE